MAKLRKGELIVNNIELSMTESLTSFLAKTISLPKIAKIINNYHQLGDAAGNLVTDPCGNVIQLRNTRTVNIYFHGSR